MQLKAITTEVPPGALVMLKALGSGENGFGGTPVGENPDRLDYWLDYCVHLATAPALSEDFLPQLNYWIKDAAGYVVGLVRLQPQINSQWLNLGGHLGYYIAPEYRRRGYGKASLRLALAELNNLGVASALVTVHIDNHASVRIVEALGGLLEDKRIDPESGQPYGRYWLPTG